MALLIRTRLVCFITTVTTGALACAAIVAPPAVRAWDDYLLQDAGLALHIFKRDHNMELRENGRLLKRFDVRLGGAPNGSKTVRGDERTPVGRYYIRAKRPRSDFRRFLGINYPSILDADRGLAAGLIDGEEWADIFFANVNGEMPRADTRLGGAIGIHGYGGRPELPVDWTQGCIAVTDSEIDFLFAIVDIGTVVHIYE